MKKYFILYVFLLIIMLFALNSCMMTTKYHISEDPILQEDEQDGIYVKCLYLDREAIIKKHGTKTNPFLSPTNLITPKTIIIFELTINNKDEAPLKLDKRDILFYYNNKSYKSMSKSQMEDKIDEADLKGLDRQKQKNIASRYMFKDITIIPGNSEHKGYLIFMKGFEDRGEGDLNLQFKSVDDLSAGDFTFYYDFVIKK